MAKSISGIQQIGIGVSKVHEAWAWYRKAFGMDVPIFEEAASAELMLPYTGGKPRSRHAVLAMNMQGGSGFEIWQYVGRTPEAPKFDIKWGDLGILSAKIRSTNPELAFESYQKQGFKLLTKLADTPNGKKHFYLSDPYNNIFEVVEDEYQFTKGKHVTGGPMGATIGVTDINKALTLYSDLLGYNDILYDKTGVFEDFKGLPGSENKFRRVLLGHKETRHNAFSQIFGYSFIELVQVTDREPQKIFKDRLWGDLGFIHLCFDIVNMKDLREECTQKGFPFTVDAGDHFDMGEAAGTFAYIEDPDGTLIEFVETFKIPILKKIGWYLDLRKRNAEKPLPKWMLKTLGLSRVKD